MVPQPREEPEPFEPRFVGGWSTKTRGRRSESSREGHDLAQPPVTVEVLHPVNIAEAIRLERPPADGGALQAEGQRLQGRVAAYPDTPIAQAPCREVRGRPLRRGKQDIRPAHDQYPDQLLGERVQVVVGAQTRLHVGNAKTRPSREHRGH